MRKCTRALQNSKALPGRKYPPLSRPGDFIMLRAEMDMYVGLTACSAEMSNNGTFKPIDAEIYG